MADSTTALAPYGSLAAYADQARAFVRAAKAKSTLRAYRADWEHFSAWCAGHGQPALPAAPETVAYYTVLPSRNSSLNSRHILISHYY
jgi:hypothetical protein